MTDGAAEGYGISEQLAAMMRDAARFHEAADPQRQALIDDQVTAGLVERARDVLWAELERQGAGASSNLYVNSAACRVNGWVDMDAVAAAAVHLFRAFLVDPPSLVAGPDGVESLQWPVYS